MREGFHSKIERKETPEEMLIIEVGSGALPMFVDVSEEYRKQFDENATARYVGVDLNIFELKEGRSLQERTDAEKGRAKNDRIQYVNAKAEALPFADSIANELVLRNVLGDPDIEVGEKHALLREAARVMKKDAILRIVEVYTPMMMQEDDLYEYIDGMEGTPFARMSDEEADSLPAHEQSADRALSRDEAAAYTLKFGTSFVLRYRRT